jgi:hypothetical protein
MSGKVIFIPIGLRDLEASSYKEIQENCSDPVPVSYIGNAGFVPGWALTTWARAASAMQTKTLFFWGQVVTLNFR